MKRHCNKRKCIKYKNYYIVEYIKKYTTRTRNCVTLLLSRKMHIRFHRDFYQEPYRKSIKIDTFASVNLSIDRLYAVEPSEFSERVSE